MRRRRGRQHARGREPRVDGHDGDGQARERPRQAGTCRVALAVSDEQLVDGTGRRGQTEHRNARRPSGSPRSTTRFSRTAAPCNLRRAARLDPHRDRTVTEVDSRNADVARGRPRGAALESAPGRAVACPTTVLVQRPAGATVAALRRSPGPLPAGRALAERGRSAHHSQLSSRHPWPASRLDWLGDHRQHDSYPLPALSCSAPLSWKAR